VVLLPFADKRENSEGRCARELAGSRKENLRADRHIGGPTREAMFASGAIAYMLLGRLAKFWLTGRAKPSFTIYNQAGGFLL
jgi:hypothetical protein